MRGLSIGKLAKAAKVSIYTIRFYEKSGLLPRPARRPSGFREYSELDLLQLQFVRQARSLGFSIEEIAGLLSLETEQDDLVLRDAVESKLKLIDRKMAQLTSWRLALEEMRKNPAGEGGSYRPFFVQLFATCVADRGPNVSDFEAQRFSESSHDRS